MIDPLVANVGTPLLTLSCFHLIVLNFAIAVFEGWLLARYAGAKRDRAVPLMVFANYGSAWAGAAVLPWILNHFRDLAYAEPPLYILEWLLLGIVMIAFVFTVIIEAPFVLSALAESPRRMKWRFLVAVWVQGVSYVGLVALYLSVSSLTVLTSHTRVRDLASFVPEIDAWVYYINPSDRTVWRTDIRGTRRERVFQLSVAGAESWYDDLYFRTSGDGLVDLMHRKNREETLIVSAIPGRRGDSTGGSSDEQAEKNWSVDFRDVTQRENVYVANPFAEGGLERRQWIAKPPENLTRTVHTTSFATALWRWQAGYPSILPTGHVVFELGDQIMIMDEQNRLGVIALGRSPVVVVNDLRAK